MKQKDYAKASQGLLSILRSERHCQIYSAVTPIYKVPLQHSIDWIQTQGS